MLSSFSSAPDFTKSTWIGAIVFGFLCVVCLWSVLSERSAFSSTSSSASSVIPAVLNERNSRYADQYASHSQLVQYSQFPKSSYLTSSVLSVDSLYDEQPTEEWRAAKKQIHSNIVNREAGRWTHFINVAVTPEELYSMHHSPPSPSDDSDESSSSSTVSHRSAPSPHSSSSSAAIEDRVRVNLYVESFCPYCRAFISGILADTLEKIGPLIHLRLVSYGNAKMVTDKKTGKIHFDCQHGPEECQGNRLELCAVDLYPHTAQWFPLLYCMAANDPLKSFDKCAQWAHLNASVIQQCAHSEISTKLMISAGKETEGLRPPKEGVPWIVIDGKPLDDEQRFEEVVCVEYVKKILPKLNQKHALPPPKQCEKYVKAF